MLNFAANAEQWIEFTGGPFDGHLQRYHSTPQRLPTEVVWLVSAEAFRQIARSPPRTSSFSGTLSSAALYELDIASALPKYRYAGSISAQSLRIAIHKLD